MVQRDQPRSQMKAQQADRWTRALLEKELPFYPFGDPFFSGKQSMDKPDALREARGRGARQASKLVRDSN